MTFFPTGDQSEQGGRVVIVTNDFSRVGTTLAMAYLIGREGKNVMVRFNCNDYKIFLMNQNNKIFTSVPNLQTCF